MGTISHNQVPYLPHTEMNPDDFSSNAPGTIVRHLSGYRAFVPHPLPPTDLPFSWELASRLSEADRAVAQLAGIARALPNVRLLVAPFVRREAVLSSRIEGTRAGVTDIARHEAGVDGEDTAAAQADTQEVVNYIRALEHGLSRLDALPISLRLVREIHETLMQGVRGEHLTPGEFRRSQNWIGRPGSTSKRCHLCSAAGRGDGGGARTVGSVSARRGHALTAARSAGSHPLPVRGHSSVFGRQRARGAASYFAPFIGVGHLAGAAFVLVGLV